MGAVLRKYRVRIVIALAALALTLGVFAISVGVYPIAIVNGSVVRARDLGVSYRAAANYYEQIRARYPSSATSTAPLGPQEIELSVLNQLVENVMVQSALRSDASPGGSDLVRDKVLRFEGDRSVLDSARALYGLTPSEFRDVILIPQAERDVLSARLYLKGVKLDEWLAAQRRSARVTILSQRYRWNGEAVVVR